jgi:hypothetical protein
MATLIEAIIFDGDPSTAVVPPGMRTVPLQAGLTPPPGMPKSHSGSQQEPQTSSICVKNQPFTYPASRHP